MANDLLDSFVEASSRYNHIVFDSRTQRFERAGLHHAIATFFRSSTATAKNRATLDAIKRFMAIEQEEKYGQCDPSVFKDYFSGITESKTIKSSTINRIVAKFRDDMLAISIAQASEKIVRKYLKHEENYDVLNSLELKCCTHREIVEKFARLIVDEALRRNPVSDGDSLWLFSHEAKDLLETIMWRLTKFMEYFTSVGERIPKLFNMLKNYDAEKGDGSNCLERFMKALFGILEKGDDFACDETALLFFLSALLYDNGLELIKNDRFSGDEIARAYNTIIDHPSFRRCGHLSAALELQLKACAMTKNFDDMEVMKCFARIVSNEDIIDDFLLITSEVVKHDAKMLSSTEEAEKYAQKANETLQFLLAQTEHHPDALEDGVQLMKDLKTIVDVETMESLLNMAQKVTDGILNPKNSVCDSIDRNLSSICFAGNTIASDINKDEKNWIVTKFVLSAASKVSYPQTTNQTGEHVVHQRTCGTRILSSARNLQVLYARAGGPLCAKYAKALKFLVDQYSMSDSYDQYDAAEANECKVSIELLEKYEVQKRTKTKRSAKVLFK